jgi:hypothetical protein
MKHVIVEFDTGAELDATECAEVVGAELVGGTDRGSDHGRWMERNRDERCEYAQGGSTDEQLRQNPSCDRERGRTARRVRASG